MFPKVPKPQLIPKCAKTPLFLKGISPVQQNFQNAAKNDGIHGLTGVMAASEIPPQMANFQTFSLKDLFFTVE